MQRNSYKIKKWNSKKEKSNIQRVEKEEAGEKKETGKTKYNKR